MFFCYSAAAQPQDVAGWSSTRWAMAPDELAKLQPDMVIGKDYLGGLTAGVISNTQIAESPFQVFLRFKGVGGLQRVGSTEPEPPQSAWRLAEVELYYKTADRRADDACYRVAEILLGKYGKPTKQESGKYGDMRLWVFPTTTIRQFTFNALNTECHVKYTPTKTSDADKL